MNQTIVDFAREEIKSGLNSLPPEWVKTFKLMYGRSGGKRSVEDAEQLTIDEVVTEVPDEKLDWALTQVQNSLKKIASREA